jgi:hypothetical protein
MTLEYALKLLRREYGAENVVHWRVSNRIGIAAQYPGEDKTISITLTIQQAKYLAAHPLNIQDLAAEQLPNESPMDEL